MLLCFFFFNDTATTEIYTLSLHDALPIFDVAADVAAALLEDEDWPPGSVALLTTHQRHPVQRERQAEGQDAYWATLDRKSTRLNSSHANISYAVFCLKKKNIKQRTQASDK